MASGPRTTPAKTSRAAAKSPNPAPEKQITTEVERDADERKISRIAVVFTHGQGEQTPMADVVELAQSLWTASPDTDLPPFERGVWSAPVFDADMSEQRRLVTGEFPMGGGATLQVDFYQFYWADLMTGNRFKHLWVWFLGLMKRKHRTEEPDLSAARGDPPPTVAPGTVVDETPPRLRKIRRIAMMAAGALAAFGVLFGATTCALLFSPHPPPERAAFALFGLLFTWGSFFSLLIGLGTLYVLVKLVRRPDREAALHGALALIPACLALGPFAEALRGGVPPVVWSAHLAVLWSLMVGATVIGLLVFWFGLRKLNDSFLTPVMTDSARLLSATPENIPNRDKIRKRGMDLLDALHTSERRYDRIVVLAHSLGTVVAYNVLAQYWGNVYRLFDRAVCAPAHARMTLAGAGLASDGRPLTGPARVTALSAFRAAVRDYYKVLTSYAARLPLGDVEWRTARFNASDGALREVLDRVNQTPPPDEASYRAPWRVSDFITIGSPLTYASLLMAGSDAELLEWVEARRYPLSPPHQGKVEEAHHASVFGATVWTNLHFRTTGLVKGDLIGGQIAGVPPKGLGLGIMDVTLPVSAAMPQFAHSEYWRWPGDATAGVTPPPHIVALRAAFNLFARPASVVEADLIAADAASGEPTVDRVSG